MRKIVLDRDGNRKWYLNDLLHRIDGPAVEWINGDKEWYLDGKLHRENGPAVEWENGYREWWFYGVFKLAMGKSGMEFLKEFNM